MVNPLITHDTKRDIQAFLRPIMQATLFILAFGVVGVQLLPMTDERRWTLSVLMVLFGTIAILTLRYIVPRVWTSSWVIYLTVIIHTAIIAFADFELPQFDVSPLYTLVVIVTAIISTRRAALFAAGLVSVIQLAVQVVGRAGPPLGPVLRIVVYLLSAILISELAQALTHYWQNAAAQSDARRKEIERRQAELQGLYEISHAFGDLEDASTTLRHVTERTAHLLDAQICFLERFDEMRSCLFGMPPGYGLDDTQIATLVHPVDREMIQFWDVERHDYLLMNDVARLPTRLVESARALGLRNVVAARLVARGRATGLILAANKLHGADFQENDGRLIAILARQAAIAVENARLFGEAQASLRNVTRLYALSAQFAQNLDPHDIPNRIVRAVAEALGAPMATLALLDPVNDQLEYAATVGVHPRALQIPFRPDGWGMTVLRTGEARFIEDLQADAQLGADAQVWGDRAVACLPIELGAKRLGLLYVSYLVPHVFTSIEKTMLGIFANQAAIALENARLYREAQKNLTDVTRLYAISAELLSNLDPKDLPQRMTQAVADALNAPIASIALLDPKTETLEFAATVGVPAQIRQMTFRKEGLGMRVVKTGQPMFISDMEKMPDPSPAAKLMPYRAVACLPIHRAGKGIGALYVNYPSPHHFTPIEKNTLAIFANQAAIALENAELYTAEKRRVAQLAVVNDLGHRVTSILDLRELAETLAQLIRAKFGYRYVHVFQVDAVNRMAELLAGKGPQPSSLPEAKFTLSFEQGMVGWVAEHGVTLLANDVAREPRFMFHKSVADTRAELTVPLKIGARTIGVLDVETDCMDAFDESDVATLETLAGQVAIAMENARLYSALQDQARRDSLTQVYNHGYFMERLTEELRRAEKEHTSLALIMLDIDHFKPYNDCYGHLMGDKVLDATVHAIRAHIKQSDWVGRWGGEEFVIALPDADIASARVVAERIRGKLSDIALTAKDGTVIAPPTVSQGIALFPTHARDTWELIDLADTALYRAKSSGRDQVCVSGEAD